MNNEEKERMPQAIDVQGKPQEGRKKKVIKQKDITKKGMKKSLAAQPPTSIMVREAIKGLQVGKGSSTQAIKTWITRKYRINVKKRSYLIRDYLKTAVSSGVLVQVRGRGATGSFKLGKPNTPGKGKPRKERLQPKQIKGIQIKKRV